MMVMMMLIILVNHKPQSLYPEADVNPSSD